MSNPFTDPEVARRYMELDAGHHVKNHAIFPTVLNILGRVYEKSILDVGCGHGVLSRRMAYGGAEVFGIDSSEEMISLARRHNEVRGFGSTSYCVADAEKIDQLTLPPINNAVAILMLNYVSTQKGLDKIFCNVHQVLKNGGSFIAFQNHMTENGFFGGQANSDRTYERVPSLSESPDVPRFRFNRRVGEREMICEINDWPMSAYELAAKRAGFSDFMQHMTGISAEGREALPKDYWINYLKNDIFRGFVATK